MTEEIFLDDADMTNTRLNVPVNNAVEDGAKGQLHDFRNRYLQSTMFQLVVFISFLVVLSIVTFGTTSSTRYHMTRAITMTFLKKGFGRGVHFDDISSILDIWKYLEEVALPELFLADLVEDANSSVQYLLGGNIVLGLPRLKQLRVRNDSCKVHRDFRALVNVCYNAYSESIEDKQPFGLENGTAWRYSSEKELDSTWYWGLLTYYSGAGNYEDLGKNMDDPFSQLSVLRTNNWITVATRIVVLDFTLYNVNVNLFSVVKLVMELPPAGGVWTSNSIRTVNLLRYVTNWDYFILAMEMLFCLFTLYYFIVEAIEIFTQGIAYFFNKWNWVDSIILIGSIVCIGFGIYRTVLMKRLLKSMASNTFANFDHLSFWQTQYDASTSVLVFLSWIKIFKYLSFNLTMIQLSTTLTQCAKDVGGFAIMFFIIFLAYAQMGYLLFGSQLLNFSRIETSIFTLMRLILGDFDYISLERANRIMGPIFFVTFVFFVFVLLLNMFLAILSDTYTNVKAKMDKEIGPRNEFNFMKSIKTVRAKVSGLFKKKDGAFDDIPDMSTNKKLKRTRIYDERPKFKNSSDAANVDEGINLSRSVSLADLEKLSIRIDDLRHEMDQIQTALITKMTLIGRNFERLAERFPNF